MAGVLWVAVVAGLGGWGVPIWFSLMLRVSLFSGFSSSNSILFRVLIVGICDPQNLLFILRKNTNQTPQKSLRISPDQESGQAISDHEIFTISYALNFHSGKMVDRSTLRVETRDSPRTVSTGESPLKNGGQQFFSRDTDEAFGRRLLGTVLAEVFAHHLHTDIAGRPFLAVELDRSQPLKIRQVLPQLLSRKPFLLMTGIDVPKTF